MRWGLEDSPGHYLDLVSAILGLTLFPAGYLAHALRSNWDIAHYREGERGWERW